MSKSSIRYCVNCNKNQRFRYNINVGHSECVHCGMRISRDPYVVKCEKLVKENEQLKERIDKQNIRYGKATKELGELRKWKKEHKKK